MKVIVALALVILSSTSVFAAEISGVQLPDQVKIQDKTLKLNGVGLRQATIFRVNVYAGALYLENLSHDAAAILGSDSLKDLEMIFMRNVDAKDISKAWNKGFEENCKINCAVLASSLDKLKALMTTDMKKGESMALRFFPNGVELFLRGVSAGKVENPEFSKTLLRIWLGENPPNESLKKGLLG
ncbi:chalcone isomerase family protein [Bdellovibrionota bacterium FG-1]